MDSLDLIKSFGSHFESFKDLFHWLLGFTFFATSAALRGLKAFEFLGIKIHPHLARSSAYVVQSLMLSLMVFTLVRMDLILSGLGEEAQNSAGVMLAIDSWPLNPFVELSTSFWSIFISGISCVLFWFCYCSTFFPAYLFSNLPTMLEGNRTRPIPLVPLAVTLTLAAVMIHIYSTLLDLPSLAVPHLALVFGFTSMGVSRLMGSFIGIFLAWGLVKALNNLATFNYEKHLIAEAYGGKVKQAIEETYGLEEDSDSD